MSTLWISWNNRHCWIWDLVEEVFQLWKESYGFQWVKDVVILAEMLCLCTTCRWWFFLLVAWERRPLGITPSLCRMTTGLATCKKSALGITSYFLTVCHKLNNIANTGFLWEDSFWLKGSTEHKYPGALLQWGQDSSCHLPLEPSGSKLPSYEESCTAWPSDMPFNLNSVIL